MIGNPLPAMLGAAEIGLGGDLTLAPRKENDLLATGPFRPQLTF